MTQQPTRKITLKEFKTMSHALSTYDNFPMMINHFIEATIRYFKVKGCSLLLLDESENQLFHVRSHGVSEEYLKKGAIFIDDKYSAFVRGEPVFIEDLQNDPRAKYPQAAAKEGFVSMLSLPIKCREATVGLVRIYHNEPWMLSDEDVDSLCVLSEQLGLIIENNGLKNFLESIKGVVESLPKRLLNQ